MSACRVLVSTLVLLCGVLSLTYARMTDWEYHMLSFNSNSTNEDVITANLRIIRMDKGVYGLNGTVTFKTELNDDYYLEVSILRSHSGSSQYTVYPMKMTNSTIYGFLNDYYKKYFMKDIEKCSNLPTFTGTWNKPVEAKEYYLNRCLFNTDYMPNHMESGYYKLVFKINGPTVVFIGEMILQIQSTLAG